MYWNNIKNINPNTNKLTPKQKKYYTTPLRMPPPQKSHPKKATLKKTPPKSPSY